MEVREAIASALQLRFNLTDKATEKIPKPLNINLHQSLLSICIDFVWYCFKTISILHKSQILNYQISQKCPSNSFASLQILFEKFLFTVTFN